MAGLEPGWYLVQWIMELTNPRDSYGIPTLRALQSAQLTHELHKKWIKVAGSENCPAQTMLLAPHL